MAIYTLLLTGPFEIAFANSKLQMETNNFIAFDKPSLITPSNEFYANAGCCSHHGGVSECDSVSGRVKCRDGSLSPTCLCKDK